jgi:nitroimidazol reductase NimA-like FMN-containing flavoprotein (pyridoxamine 5'-phosphate oxidase superfamily)
MSVAYRPSDKIGPLTDAELATFLEESWNGRLATITADGWPYVAPVWYEFERDRRSFLVVGRERAQWIAHIRANRRVAFHVADDVHAHHTRVQVQADARILEGPIAPTASPTLLALTHRLARRYLGPDGPRYAERTIGRPRVLVRLEPVKWTTWTGQEWHPRYR